MPDWPLSSLSRRTGEDVRVISIARTDKEEADEDEAETEADGQ